MTQFTSGFTYNVFPDDAFIQGSIRAYNHSVVDLVKAKIKKITESTSDAMGCKAEVKFIDMYPSVINH